MNLHQHVKNQINSSIHSCDTADFVVSWLKRWQTHFWLGPPIVISCPEFLSPFQKSVDSIDSFMRYSQFKSPVTEVVLPVFDHIHRNIFISTLNFWYHYAKKQAISSLCFKILQCYWEKNVLAQYDWETKLLQNYWLTAFTFG